MLRIKIKCNREDLNNLKRQKMKREVAAGLHETYIQMKRNVRIVPFQTYSDYMREKEEKEKISTIEKKEAHQEGQRNEAKGPDREEKGKTKEKKE